MSRELEHAPRASEQAHELVARNHATIPLSFARGSTSLEQTHIFSALRLVFWF